MRRHDPGYRHDGPVRTTDCLAYQRLCGVFGPSSSLEQCHRIDMVNIKRLLIKYFFHYYHAALSIINSLLFSYALGDLNPIAVIKHFYNKK